MSEKEGKEGATAVILGGDPSRLKVGWIFADEDSEKVVAGLDRDVAEAATVVIIAEDGKRFDNEGTEVTGRFEDEDNGRESVTPGQLWIRKHLFCLVL